MARRTGRDSAATRVWTGVALYTLLVAGELRVLSQTGLAIAAWCGPRMWKAGACICAEGQASGTMFLYNFSKKQAYARVQESRYC